MTEFNSKTGLHESDHLIKKTTDPNISLFHCLIEDNKTIVESAKF